MLLAVVCGVVFTYVYRRGNEEIRSQIEARIAKHYAPKGLKVSLRSAELVSEKGIRIRDVSIVETPAEGPQAEVLHIDEMFLDCPTDWQHLIQGDVPVRRVTISRPTLHITRRPGDQWSAAKLLPTPQFGDRPPEVHIEGGIVEIFDPLKTPAGALTLREVTASLIPIAVAQPGAKPGSRQVKAVFSGDGFRHLECEGSIDMQAGEYSIRGQVENVDISPELRDSLPNPLCEKLLAIGNLRGQGNLRFDLTRDAAADSPLKFNVTGRLVRGRIDDPRLPHALSDIKAAVHADNAGISIDDLSARSGQGTLRMSCRRTGFESNSPLQLTAEVRKLTLDSALLGILSQSLQDQWQKFRPAGEIDADIKLTFDGKNWRPEIAAQCLDVSFTHHKFPYRLEHGQGAVTLKDDLLKLNMTAFAGSRPVRLAAEVIHPTTGPTGWFEAKGDDLQIDEAVIVALPPKSGEVVRSLDPRGTVNFYMRLWRDQPNEPLHKHLQIATNRCSVRYAKFPYSLSEVRGTIEMFDESWTFRNFEGVHDKARVTCEGRLTPGLSGNELVLNFVGRDVPLGDELRDALTLSPHIQQVWLDIRPRGTVDLSAEVRYVAEQKHFSVGVQVKPQPRDSSIEPTRFPYRLDRLQGTVDYRDGHVTFSGCKAEHGPVKISAEGSCDFQPDGRSVVRFTRLSADRLRASDRELIQALPERLRKTIAELNPTGAFNLDGAIQFERTGGPDDPLQASWDVLLGLHQTNLQLGGIAMDNVHGRVSLVGRFNGQNLESRGELALDSANYKDCQFTQIMGPIWIDDGRILFGSWVDRRDAGTATVVAASQVRPPRPITALLFGGKFSADGWATIEPEPKYAIDAALTDADLARCAREIAPGHSNLRGRVAASAHLKGAGRTRNTLSGGGAVQLSDGDVYQLPLMVSLLKLLSIRPPDQNAFSSANIAYRIEGEHIYLEQINFHGDAVSLRGKGDMDFQSRIRMTFYSTVGRGELEIPVINQVFRGASQQIMLIHVNGTLQNPEVRKEVLPALNQLREDIEKIR